MRYPAGMCFIHYNHLNMGHTYDICFKLEYNKHVHDYSICIFGDKKLFKRQEEMKRYI